ncbi:MAG: SpoIIE family protein phosphatase [Clostridia bacterium]|nr:SpoIIE family protein phosphatase [Clostridia bacterium]
MKETTITKIEEYKPVAFKFFKYFGYIILFYIFANAKVFGQIKPCFYGLFLTLMFLGESPFYLSLSFLIGYFLSNLSLNSILFGLFICFLSNLIVFFHNKKEKPLSSFFAFIYCVALGIPYLYFNFSNLSQFYFCFLDVVLNSVFLLCAFNFFKILKTRNFNLNLNVDEIVCGGFVLIFLFCGLQNLGFLYFDIVKFTGVFLVLVSTYLLKNSFSVLLAVVSGLGAGLTNGNLNYLTLFSIVAVVANIFKGYSRIYSTIGVLLSDLVFGAFFILNQFSVLNFLPTIVAGTIFFLIPKKFLENLKKQIYLKNESNSLKNILNQNKLQLSKRLLYTSEVFYQMDKSFRKLVKGSLDAKSAKLMICNEIIKYSCENCPQKTKCLKGFNSEHKKIFEQLINTGFEKGKITLVDLPAYLTSRCTKLNQVVSHINALLNEYKSYSKMCGNLDASKVLIADQLGGISYILNNLSQETKQVVQMDLKLEKQIKENLIYNDIVPSEVVCFEKDEKTNIVSMLVRTIDFDNEKITRVLNKSCSCKMVLEDILPNMDNNLTYLSYKTAPVYDIAVGIAQSSKGGEDVCGDTHSASKLTGDKFMFALCDGMGHGEKANKASELSIGLIENFYKAGYDNQTILTSVNNLLNLGREDVFSALDISVVDLKNGQVDFIKQGATIGFVKKGESLSKIESNSLPLGILQEVKPKVTKTVLSTDDMVIMLSDGVVDAFKEDDLEVYLKSLKENNPQVLADKILNKAKRQQKNYPEDDMTVMVGKIFYNYA